MHAIVEAGSRHYCNTLWYIAHLSYGVERHAWACRGRDEHVSLQLFLLTLVVHAQRGLRYLVVCVCVCVCVCVQLMQLRDKSKHTDSLSIVFCSVFGEVRSFVLLVALH